MAVDVPSGQRTPPRLESHRDRKLKRYAVFMPAVYTGPGPVSSQKIDPLTWKLLQRFT